MNPALILLCALQFGFRVCGSHISYCFSPISDDLSSNLRRVESSDSPAGVDELKPSEKRTPSDKVVDPKAKPEYPTADPTVDTKAKHPYHITDPIDCPVDESEERKDAKSPMEATNRRKECFTPLEQLTKQQQGEDFPVDEEEVESKSADEKETVEEHEIMEIESYDEVDALGEAFAQAAINEAAIFEAANIEAAIIETTVKIETEKVEPVKTVKADSSYTVECVDVESDEEANEQVSHSAKFNFQAPQTPVAARAVKFDLEEEALPAPSSDLVFLEFNAKHNTIKSVTGLGIGERLAISSTVFKQTPQSQDFKSKIKFADFARPLFLFKIALILRQHDKKGVMLTAVELNEDKLLTIIRRRGLEFEVLVDIMELLLRAGYEKACKRLKALVLAPALYAFPKSSGDVAHNALQVDFLYQLSFRGQVLLMQSLLKEESIGIYLRNHLKFSEVFIIFENILMNGGISEAEVIATLKVLLIDSNESEFIKRYGCELAAICKGKRSGTLRRTLCPRKK